MHGAVKLLIGLGVVGGLLVAADRVAVGVAEDQAADAAVSSGWLTDKPEVEIGDVPFLTSAVAGELDQVDLSSNGMTVTDGKERVTVHSFKASLSQVKFTDSYRGVTVGRGDGQGVVDYKDLAKFMKGGGLLGLEYAGPGAVKASVPGGGITGKLHSEGDEVVVDDVQLTGTASALKGLAGDLLKPQRFRLTGLPRGLSLAEATPEPDGVRLRFTVAPGTTLGH
ncbi:LmeA family phospholipid-binding protein [Kitasatospora sp. NPDC004531]